MYIASLSSSSTYGNAYLVWDDSERPILIDCGVSLKKILESLKSLGMDPRDLAALFITHEHVDHIKAMCLKTPIAEKFKIPVYASRGFWEWYDEWFQGHLDPSLRRIVEAKERVRLDGRRVHAFAKPHDAKEPLGFIVEGKDERAGFVMDLGYVPQNLLGLLRGVERLVFESNHDVEMEKSSGRPWHLILRVMGSLGHLSNDQAAQALSETATKETKEIILAHLSLDCNRADVAMTTVRKSLEKKGIRAKVSLAPAFGMRVFTGKDT